MAEREAFGAWLARRGSAGVPTNAGLVGVRRWCSAEPMPRGSLLADLDELHRQYCAELGLPQVRSVRIEAMGCDDELALAGLL